MVKTFGYHAGQEKVARSIMATHLIDEAALAAMERDDYEGFLQARERRIMAALAAYLKV
jgi:hypothetical protein